MATKRFTAVNKWDQVWFRKLSPKLKCVWMFMVDRCDHAGILEFDLESMSFFIGEEVTLSEIKAHFSEQIEFISDEKIIISAFIEFQYGNLNPANRVHKSIINKINSLAEKNKIIPLTSPLKGAMEKEEDKDKDNVFNNKKKDVNEFSSILSPAETHDISLRNAAECFSFEELINKPSVFGERLPVEISRNKTKFLTTLVHVYAGNSADFADHLKAIINEGFSEEKSGVSRAEYVLTRIKKKALELYRAT